MPQLSDIERDELRKRILGFLRGTLLPHAKAEEEVLYPAWAELVGFADAAVPMVHDHEAIVARVERLEGVDASDVDALQELLYGLYALISVHFRKEGISSCRRSTRRRRSPRACWSAWARCRAASTEARHRLEAGWSAPPRGRASTANR